MPKWSNRSVCRLGLSADLVLSHWNYLRDPVDGENGILTEENTLPERWCRIVPLMRNTSEWPLPSNSRRVRAYFYLADGLMISGGLIILSGVVVFLLFLLYRSYLDGIASAGGVLIVFLFGYILLQRTAAFREASRTSPAEPPESNDWGKTRDWMTMAVVVFLIVGCGLGLLLVLWAVFRGWTVLFSFLIPFVLFQLGIVFRLYGFHRLGMRVL